METDPLPQVRLSYTGEAQSVVATHVHTWKRDDIEISRGMVMSNSSGPKDTIVNRIISVFNSHPAIDAVSMVVARGIPLLIIQAGGLYFDVTMRPVTVLQAVVDPNSREPARQRGVSGGLQGEL